MTRNEIIKQLGAYAYTAAVTGERAPAIPIELIKETIRELAKEADDGD